MSDITHERCSESLPGLLARRLAPDEALAVEEHLEGCGECRAELAGLKALTEGLTPLSELERAGLRRAVRSTLPEAEVLGPDKAPVWRRAAPFLSAAAALLILGFAITSLDLGGSDEMAGSDVGAEAEGGGAELDRSQEDEGDTAAGGSGKENGNDQATVNEALPDAAAPEDAAEEQAGSDVAASEAAVGGRERGIPVFGLGQRFSIERLQRETEARGPYRSAARSFDPESLADDRDEHLRTLGRLARFRGRSGDLKRCARSLVGSEGLLPVLGAYGTFEGQKALVLGFISATGGSYDRYLIAIWTPPDKCSNPRILQGRLR